MIFPDKTVLVTGLQQRLWRGDRATICAGRRTCCVAARREEVLRALAQRIEKDGGRALVCPCDVGDEAQIRAAVEKIDAELGPIHVLVNNAGTNVTNRSIDATTTEDWRVVADVNLVSAYLFTNLLMPQMKARGAGTIINIGSRAANYPSLLSGVAYSSAKLGMQALNRVTNEEGNPARRARLYHKPGRHRYPPPRPPAQPAPPGSPQADDAGRGTSPPPSSTPPASPCAPTPNASISTPPTRR